MADFFYISAGAFGISKAPHMIGTALIIALGAGFFEEYVSRGLFLKLAFQDGVKSSKQVLGVVLLSALSFGLAHLGNLTHQPLNATLFQVYYATAIGIFYACYLPTYW
ncbi:MAG: type II CAAX prenyl endopeptidase Rce1 family protein [Streptococcus salivarius]